MADPGPSKEESTDISYPKLPPRPFASVDPPTYIAERFNDAISWYDKKAVTCKSRHQWMRAVSVIGGVLVPVLVNVSLPGSEIYLKAVTTVLSTLVVLLVSLESVFHYREQWVNYRSTEQFLRREYFLFTAKEGVYTDLRAHDAFRVFVERVEAKIESENASTLQILTTVTEAPKGQTAEQEGP
jgi:hypothetical protein